ncbi:MAG: MFS transporter [Spirochaetales bacterium]|nr:MFS transporter [Spirochaetales bacterium]
MDQIKENRKRLTSTSEFLSYSAYPLGTNLTGMLVLSFLSMFYTDEVGLATTAVAGLMVAAKIWDALKDLLFGVIIDRVRRKKGKFLHWINAGVFLLPLTTFLLFMNIHGSPLLNLGYAYLTYFIWGISGTISNVPHTAMVTAMTDNIKERTSLLSWAALAGIVGSVITGILGGSMIYSFGFSTTGLLICSAAFLLMLPMRFFAKERIRHFHDKTVRLNEVFRILAKNKYLLAFSLSYLCLLATNFVMTIGPYFVKWNLGGLDLMWLIMLGNVAPVALLPVLMPVLIPRFGKRKLYIFGTALGTVISVAQYFLGYENLALFMAANAVKVLGIYLPVTMANMIIADCSEYNAYNTGTRNDGMNFALGSFIVKIGGALSSGLAVFLLGIFGYDGMAAVQTDRTLEGIWLLTSILPAIGLAAAGIIFRRYYKLEEKDVAGMINAMEKMEGIRPGVERE